MFCEVKLLFTSKGVGWLWRQHRWNGHVNLNMFLMCKDFLKKTFWERALIWTPSVYIPWLRSWACEQPIVSRCIWKKLCTHPLISLEGRSPCQPSLCVCVCIPVHFSSNNSCQRAAETCRGLSVSIQTLTKWHWDVFHSSAHIAGPFGMASSCGYRPQHVRFSAPCNEWRTGNKWLYPRGWERGVSEAKKDKRSRFQQIHQVHQTTYSLLTRKQRVKPYCFHLVCRSAQGEKAFHAPTVDQSLSTDPGRITKEPICVR